jgi:hypothetical protein
VDASTWIREERQLLDTMGKNRVVSCPPLYFQVFTLILLVVTFACLFVD